MILTVGEMSSNRLKPRDFNVFRGIENIFQKSVDFSRIACYIIYIHNKAKEPRTMTYRELQQALKQLRNKGIVPASFKLNQKKTVLQAMWEKVNTPIAAPTAERVLVQKYFESDFAEMQRYYGDRYSFIVYSNLDDRNRVKVDMYAA